MNIFCAEFDYLTFWLYTRDINHEFPVTDSFFYTITEKSKAVNHLLSHF